MPLYSYRGLTISGRFVSGTESASSPRAARLELVQRGLHLVDVSAGAARPAGRKRLLQLNKTADVADSIRYLATLVEADLPLDTALVLTADSASRDDVREGFRAARNLVRSGTPLSRALDEQERVVPRIAVGIVSVAERTGELAPALLRLSEYLEERERLRSELMSALSYPALMAILGSASVAVLLGYVLPRFAEVLSDTGVPLPATTSALVGFGSFLAASWPLMVVVLAIIAIVTVRFRSYPEGQRIIHGLLLRVPALGTWRAQHAAVQLGTSLSVMLGQGTPLLAALEMGGEAMTDEHMRVHVREARQRVRDGKSLSEAFGAESPLPFAFRQMTRVGEESGTLANMLSRAAAVTEADLSRKLHRAVRLIEPLMILVFGVAIGFVALALLQAVYGVQGGAL